MISLQRNPCATLLAIRSDDHRGRRVPRKNENNAVPRRVTARCLFLEPQLRSARRRAVMDFYYFRRINPYCKIQKIVNECDTLSLVILKFIRSEVVNTRGWPR